MRGFRSFAKGLGGAVLGSSDSNADAVVESLLQRASDGVLQEDRREAFADLRDLLSHNLQAQLAVSSQGLPVICTVIKEDREDLDMLRTALECLQLTIGHPANHLTGSGKGPAATAVNAGLFSQSKENLQMLLVLLEDAPMGVLDFYVRYHTVQILTALAAVASSRVQEAVLDSPTGVVRLMDMLGDKEALRNEALLLFMGLSRSNATIQQIAAFEGAFERLLNIIKEEGAADGDIVVQDCLEVLNNLVRGNPKNQLLFREMGHLSSLPELFQTNASMHKPLPRQRTANLMSALDTFQLILAPPSGTQGNSMLGQASTQTSLVQAGCMPALLHLLGLMSVPVQIQALKCIELLIRGNHYCQQHLLEAVAPGGPDMQMPALQVIAHMALHAQDRRLQHAAMRAVQGFCIANPEGQLALLSDLPHSAIYDFRGTGAIGKLLLHALHSPALQAMQAKTAAAHVLATVLAGNQQSKEVLLANCNAGSQSSLQMPDSSTTIFVVTLQQALASHADETGNRAQHVAMQSQILLLYITWLKAFTPGVSCLLADPDTLQLLTGAVTDEAGLQGPLLAGLATLLLGVCIMYAPQEEQAGVQAAVTSGVSPDRLFGAISTLKQSPEYTTAASGVAVASHQAAPLPAMNGMPGEEDDQDTGQPNLQQAPRIALDTPFDREATELIASVEQQLQQRLLGSQHTSSSAASNASHAAVNIELQQARHLIAELQRQLQEERRSSNSHATSSAAESLHKQSTAITQAQSPENSSAVRQADLAAQQAQAEAASLRDQVSELTGEVSELQSKLAAADEERQSAAGRCERVQGEMQDLSEAYNNLEVHSYQLEAQIRRLQQPARSDPGAITTDKKLGGDTESEVELNGAADDADMAADDAMADLLMCLGLEEQKTQILQAKLGEMGVDVMPLLDAIGADKQDELDLT